MPATTDNPSLSVLVPAYGVAHLLGEALASLQAQTRGDWEAIVVDDGAPDDVSGAVARFVDDPRIRYLQTDNGGLATARNRAAAIARAPFVALLDGDDAWEPHYVETMLETFARRPDIDMLTCDATFFGLADRAERLFSDYCPQQGAITLERVLTRDFNVFVGSTIRRSAFDAVGGFDGALRSVEDLDLWIRLLAAGHPVALVPEPLVRYRRRPGSLSSDTRTMGIATRAVYAKTAAALAGRTEEATATRMLARLEAEQAWTDGEDLILAGEARRGLAMMRGMEGRSLRWRVALPVMRLLPMLARLILRIRPALPEPHRR